MIIIILLINILFYYSIIIMINFLLSRVIDFYSQKLTLVFPADSVLKAYVLFILKLGDL